MTLMKAPENGVSVRMYRQGHGDCFLLAFPRKGGGNPVYTLIDCGYKPGSQAFLYGHKIGEIVEHIGESTDHHLDLVVITHEHQDHVNGIWKKSNPYFKNFSIEEAWFAWTENPEDKIANRLRKDHKDQLLTLVKSREKLELAVGVQDPTVRRLDDLLALETGGHSKTIKLAKVLEVANDPKKSLNKQAMKLIKDKATEKRGVQYLQPSQPPEEINETEGVRAFVLGPPRKEDLLKDENPIGDEGFRDESHGFSFASAAALETEEKVSPFRTTYCISENQALDEEFFEKHYGVDVNDNEDYEKEVSLNASWRRINGEWLYSADKLALKLNTGINNTSLVLAFELPISKKVLLFVGDAQRGSWISWTDNEWKENDDAITVRDILARTVLYKVGHHGSHNATLAGKPNDEYANLSWMGHGSAADEFCAMITAVNKWAITKNNPPWRHPLPAIKKALEEKCQGRVFQTDIDQPKKPDGISDEIWDRFLDRASFEEMYFEYVITDD
ncbi:hypothetical protein [uncultured Gimesia sp.]|uniref:hypothetical protein n=1 Tax=uncultured Gimesia sp. TaxID=1678688 RepID=UPI0030DC5F6C|tara:strand:- start:4692 stop:6197 length:1506 start_codon:yes stop_codon:yes gene_type:complete